MTKYAKPEVALITSVNEGVQSPTATKPGQFADGASHYSTSAAYEADE